MFSTSFSHFSHCSNISSVDFHGTKTKCYRNPFMTTSFMFQNVSGKVLSLYKLSSKNRYRSLRILILENKSPLNVKRWRILQPLWKAGQRFLKELKLEISYGPEIPFLGIYPKKIKALFKMHNYMHSYVYCKIIYNSQNMEAT